MKGEDWNQRLKRRKVTYGEGRLRNPGWNSVEVTGEKFQIACKTTQF